MKQNQENIFSVHVQWFKETFHVWVLFQGGSPHRILLLLRLCSHLALLPLAAGALPPPTPWGSGLGLLCFSGCLVSLPCCGVPIHSYVETVPSGELKWYNVGLAPQQVRISSTCSRIYLCLLLVLKGIHYYWKYVHLFQAA